MWIEQQGAPVGQTGLASVVRSLREIDAEFVLSVVPTLGADWAMTRVEDCHGGMMLLVEPPEEDNSSESGAVGYLIHRTAQGVQVAAVQAENAQALGGFETVRAAMRHVSGLVTGVAAVGFGEAA